MDTRHIKNNKQYMRLTSEGGYLLVSTLFFLMFSGIFAQSMIKITSNQMIQINQITASYQARASLNMGKELLLEEINGNIRPDSGRIKTSVGNIKITSEDSINGTMYYLTLTTNTGSLYKDNLFVEEDELDADHPDSNEEFQYDEEEFKDSELNSLNHY